MRNTEKTLGDIASYGQQLIVYCRTCCHHKSMDPSKLLDNKIKASSTLEELNGAFQCTRCDSTNTGAELRQSVMGKNWR